MTKVVWLREALADLQGISAYIAKDNPIAARRARSRQFATTSASCATIPLSVALVGLPKPVS
jgi:plasmid stabilization system protein ParE